MKYIWLSMMVVHAAWADSLLERRMAALAEYESHNQDQARGRAGEVSRYQILPIVWRDNAPPIANPRNPQMAKTIAMRIVRQRCQAFIRRTGREPSDQEFYALWNAPDLFRRKGYVFPRLPPKIRLKSRQFAKLTG